MNKHILFLLAILLLTGCSNLNKDFEQRAIMKKGGFFSLRTADGFNVTSLKTLAKNKTSIDIGDLKSSDTIYFLVTNGGDTAIENVVISSNKTAFKIKPEKIERLEPAGELSIQHVLAVTLKHGTDSVGFVDMLSKSDIKAVIDLSGATTANNQSKNATGSIEINLKPLIADVDIFINGNELNYSSYQSEVDVNNEVVRRYQVNTTDTVKIVNSGNVDLHYAERKNTENKYPETTTLKPGQEVSFTHSVSGSYFYKFETNNTVSDYNKFVKNTDGHIHFYIHYN